MRRDLTQPSPSINLVNENEGDFEHMRLHEGSQSPVNPFEPEQPHREYDYSPQRSTDSDSFHFQTSNEEKGGPEYQAQEQNRYHIDSQDVLTYNQYVHKGYPDSSDSQSLYSQSPILPRDRSFQPLLNRDTSPLPRTRPTSELLSTTTIPAYDRYPKQYATSTQLSTSSLLYDDEMDNSISSPSYDNDFSPFGGYPASQFPLSIDEKEPDDYLHNPDPVLDADYNRNRFIYDLKHMDRRSFNGALALLVMILAAIGVFIVLPVLTFTNSNPRVEPQVYEVLTQYQYPMLSAIRQDLIDPDTPAEALTNVGQDGRTWKLVFSDEFNAEGRTFYDGDDQFFTAPDFHYAATQDLEWYDPDAVTTVNGTLELTMDAFKNHDLFYRSGMVQSWNKMCYTQGKLEFSASLPGYGNISGLWPGLWSMGNLGRPGYLATTEGVWPYTYDTCDAGITPNQSSPDGISYLPGQRLNKCTCSGESHPNPGVGRGAPEIDALEGEIHGIIGRVSQSLQIAPYDIWYMPDYDFIEIYNSSVTLMNTYAGGPFQQAVSGVTMLNTTWYQFGDDSGRFQKFGYEYLNDDATGYITWFVGDDATFSMKSTALHPNGNVGWRQIPKEPISIIMNLGISNSWAYIDWPSLVFPSKMRVDYVRVYQPEDAVNMGCDPANYPTYDYIQQHLNIYQDMNLTTFEDGGYTFPKNKLTGC
ncbi:Skn1 protein [Candida orthopsilosis Co 90-125]|uniref:Skn1 protein n=1 Tax=Candida orthopsilosis (strain 90-125) TaxID=1136231 RepID=H8X2M4_CANO9|nr:Skn1 protein [Candida orthopsilosis Co 90-125]CCG25571.1 Skn1 protein [Candida orthopsilosis Co 90-125]